MSATANFASTPRREVADISVANANRDGTGTIVDGFTAGASGARVDRIEIKALAATTAGMVRAFTKDGGGAWKLWREFTVDAITPSATVSAFSSLNDDIGEILKAGVKLGFSTHNGEAFTVHIGGGDF